MAEKTDPLAPSGLDKQIEQQTVDTFQKAREQTERQKEDAKAKQTIDRFDEIRKMGFVSQKDIEEFWSAKVKDLDETKARYEKAYQEVQEIRERFKQPKNSGALDGVKPKAKNPLLDYWER